MQILATGFFMCVLGYSLLTQILMSREKIQISSYVALTMKEKYVHILLVQQNETR